MTTKLLAVDDSKTMRKVLDITFSGDEYHSIIASNADEAVSALRNDTPHIALIDAHLGMESGYDLCRQVKSALPHVKVLLLTSKQRPYDAEQGSAAGADDYFDKPFDSQKLLDKVSALAVALEAAPPAPPEPAPVLAEETLDTPLQMPTSEPVQLEAQAPEAEFGVTEELDELDLEEEFVAPEPLVEAVPIHSPAAAEPAAVAPAAAAPAAVASAAVAPAAVAPVAVAPALNDLESKLQGLGLDAQQLSAVLSLSREVVEQVVWEVVPQLAETMIKEEIKRLTTE